MKGMLKKIEVILWVLVGIAFIVDLTLYVRAFGWINPFALWEIL